MSRIAFVIGLFGAALALPGPAAAEGGLCTDRAKVLKSLKAQYAEAPVAMGLANNGGVIEVLSSDDRASWTIIITMPSGVTCLIAAGESWERLPLATAGSKI